MTTEPHDNDGSSDDTNEHVVPDLEAFEPEPLEAGIEDIPKAFPHGDNPHPPSESGVQVPG